LQRIKPNLCNLDVTQTTWLIFYDLKYLLTCNKYLCFTKQNKYRCNTNNLIDFLWFKIFAHLQQISMFHKTKQI
jgi:hypothetical protein